ncbi:portal protein [Rosenbergiella collisarenosi]|uniref:portal protein n=1 Tax=Rosenbergiella collisarenosi TaxID=1544695 RepID=UPI001F4DBA02|nr:portal protein [Rosenbergiella collisarenosi]
MAKIPKPMNGVVKSLRQLFGGNRPTTQPFYLSTGSSVVSRSAIAGTRGQTEGEGAMSGSGDNITSTAVLPDERNFQYAIFEEMAKSPTVNAALSIHITYALAPDKKTGRAFVISPKDMNDKEAVDRCAELSADLGEMINTLLPSMAMIMSVFGVGYCRPYATQGKGITGIESSFYTLPYFVREYYQGNQLMGFAGDYITKKNSSEQVLSEPWLLVPMKTPFWKPSGKLMPVNTSTQPYSLLDDQEDKQVQETQNYGTSFLESSYEPWLNLCGALKALKAVRYNSAKIDRLIALATDSLDVANAANYTRTIAQSLKRNSDMLERRATSNLAMPTVMNHLIPVMGNGKNGITVDTQSIPADINGIEDVMFHLRQLAASLGVDSTMLGWADQMSGGLGEGGWAQTAIQAALRANWIRAAAKQMIERLIDIHLAYKYGKTYIGEDRPFTVSFHSMNTAIQEEENRELDARANFVTLLVQVMDAINNSPKMSGSDTFMSYLFIDQLKMTPEQVGQMIKEFRSIKSPDEQSGGGSMMNESAPQLGDDPANWSNEQLVSFAHFILNPQEQK